jgi:hypothetical protein
MLERVFVASAMMPDGERFCILRPEAGAFFPRGTVTTVRAAVEDYMRAVPWLTEDDLRRDLESAGLTTVDVERQLERARALREHPPEYVLEHMTAIGHRTAHGQVVMRKTERAGAGPFGRVYALRCERCHYEHDSDGGDIHRARCPHCEASIEQATANGG